MFSASAAQQRILDDRWALLARLGLWALAWVAAVWFAFRLPMRTAVPAVLALAALVRLAALASPPSTSDDLYRYAWDARVQAAGIDPYQEPPSSPSLDRLRDSWLWPGPGGCAAIHRAPGCTRLNRPAARTIYPPVAQLWFLTVRVVTGGGGRERPWQAAAALIDLGLCVLLVFAFGSLGRDPRLVTVYALCPVVVFELANNAHVDGLAVVLIVAALVAHQRDRPVAAGVLLGLAAMIKLYPAALLPALWRKRPIVTTSAFAAVCVAAYLPHVVAVGGRVVGYLPGYLREEHYGSGGRFLLLGLTGLSGRAVTIVALLVVAATAAWVIRRRPPAEIGTVVLLGVLLLVATPVQPWYAVTLAAVAVVAARPAWLAVALAGEVTYFAVILDHPHAIALGRISYGLAALAIGAAELRRSKPRHR